MSDFPKILLCVLTTYERHGWPTRALLELIEHLRSTPDPRYAVAVTTAHNFIPAAGARNTFCRHARDSDADWLLMIDNDMSPPANLLDTIKDAPDDADIIVPKFHLWDESNMNLKLCWGMDDHPDIIAGKSFRLEPKFYKLTKCGTGCIFIKPAVFKMLPPPWFWYTIDEDQNMESTEDINFCLKARAAGFNIYGNGAITVGHHHTVDLSVLAKLLHENQKKELDNEIKLGSESEISELAKSPSAVPVAAVSPTCSC